MREPGSQTGRKTQNHHRDTRAAGEGEDHVGSLSLRRLFLPLMLGIKQAGRDSSFFPPSDVRPPSDALPAVPCPLPPHQASLSLSLFPSGSLPSVHKRQLSPTLPASRPGRANNEGAQVPAFGEITGYGGESRISKKNVHLCEKHNRRGGTQLCPG